MTEITARLSTALADRYKLERHLGEGGMATVYLAEDIKHKRKVAVKGGAHIADVECPSSALGTPYPLNIKAVRDRLDAGGLAEFPISTNIGEEQGIRSSACQAALGVAVASADYVRCGLAGLDPKAAGSRSVCAS